MCCRTFCDVCYGLLWRSSIQVVLLWAEFCSRFHSLVFGIVGGGSGCCCCIYYTRFYASSNVSCLRSCLCSCLTFWVRSKKSPDTPECPPKIARVPGLSAKGSDSQCWREHDKVTAASTRTPTKDHKTNRSCPLERTQGGRSKGRAPREGINRFKEGCFCVFSPSLLSAVFTAYGIGERH